MGSDEAAHYETRSSDWRCQDCNGPQFHADCVLSNAERVLQRLGHAGPRLSSIIQRGREPIDCDMPDRLNADSPTPSRPHVAAADGSSMLTNDMLMDQDASNPLILLSSRDFPVPIDQPPRNKRSPKVNDSKKGSNGPAGSRSVKLHSEERDGLSVTGRSPASPESNEGPPG